MSVQECEFLSRKSAEMTLFLRAVAQRENKVKKAQERN